MCLPTFPYDLSRKTLSRVRRVHRRLPGAARPTPVAPKLPSTSIAALADAIEHLRHIFMDWTPSGGDVEFSLQFHDREIALELERSIVSRMEPWLYSGVSAVNTGVTVCGVEFKIPPPPPVPSYIVAQLERARLFSNDKPFSCKDWVAAYEGKNASPDERLEDAPQVPTRPPPGGAT